MNRFSQVLGVVGLTVLAFACSSRDEEPVPFAPARDLASELATEYGTAFAVENVGKQAFWASPLGDSRALAASPAEAERVATEFVRKFGSEFGAGSDAVRVKIVRVDNDETGGYAVRFVQLVPGTEIRVVDTGGGIDIASDGTLRGASAVFVPANAFPTSASVTAAQVEAEVRRAVPASSFTVVDAPMLFARPTGNAGAALAYRMTFVADDEGYEAWVDANDIGRMGLTQPRGGADSVDTPARAWPFSAYPFANLDPANLEKQGVPIAATTMNGKIYLIQQPTAERSKINTVEQKGEGRIGEPVRYDFIKSPDGHDFRGTFPINIAAIAGLDAYVAPAHVDAHYNTALVDLAYRRVVKEGPTRDGVLGVLTHANSRVVRKAQRKADGTTTWTEVVDSTNPKFNAAYDPIAGLVAFGDGGPSLLGLVLPPSTALDIVGHEWTHAFMTRKTGFTLVGEDGAIQETVGDAVGKTIAIRNGDTIENEIGRKMFFSGGAIRSFANPADFKADSEAVTEDGGSSSVMARLPSRVEQLDFGCMLSLKVDNGCVHLNAGPGNRAFYLMKEGLKRVSPAAEKNELWPWLARLESVWFYSAGHAVRAPQGTTGGHYEALALQQIDYARKWGTPVQKEVACAWFAVGAIKGPTLAQRGIICPVADTTERASVTPSDCGGRADGLYCSETSPFSATLCKAGSIAGAQQCPSGHVCVVENAATRAAKLDSNGAMACESAQ